MADKKVFQMSTGDAAIMVFYNDVNLRVGNIRFEVPNNVSARARIWESGELVYDHIYGEGVHEEKVPGNVTLIEVSDPEHPELGTWYEFPPEYTYQMNFQFGGS